MWFGAIEAAAKTVLPVYRRFTEGLKAADLLNAKALLDTLRPWVRRA